METAGGRVTPEDFARRIDSRTRAILLAAVQEINGFRADVKAIAALAREHGCFLIVDGIQEAGAMQVDVREPGVDFYHAGGKKWIGNPLGTGFLYIRKPLLETLPLLLLFGSTGPLQILRARSNHLCPGIPHVSGGPRPQSLSFRMKRDATVFEAGGYDSYPGAMGLSRALRVLQEQGMASVESRIRSRTRRPGQGLERLGLTVNSPCEGPHSPAIVSFALHDPRDCNVDRERQLADCRRKRNIFVSLRCSTHTGGIRVPPHYYTPEHHIDRFLNAVAGFCG